MFRSSPSSNRLLALECELLGRCGMELGKQRDTQENPVLGNGRSQLDMMSSYPGMATEQPDTPRSKSTTTQGNRLLALENHLGQQHPLTPSPPHPWQNSQPHTDHLSKNNTGFTAHTFDHGAPIQVTYPQEDYHGAMGDDWHSVKTTRRLFDTGAPIRVEQHDPYEDLGDEDDWNNTWNSHENNTWDDELNDGWDWDDADMPETPQPSTWKPETSSPKSETIEPQPVHVEVVVDNSPRNKKSEQRPLRSNGSVTRTVDVKTVPAESIPVAKKPSSPMPDHAQSNGHHPEPQKVAAPTVTPTAAKKVKNSAQHDHGATPQSVASTSSPPVAKAMANDNVHAGFGNLSRELNNATSFNLGTVTVEIPFDDFDRQLAEEDAVQAQSLAQQFDEFDQKMETEESVLNHERAPP